jgi:hypothetical protein
VAMSCNGSFWNRPIGERLKKCGCCFCLRIFETFDIRQWLQEKTTPICPHCSMDALVPEDFGLDAEVMKARQECWFTPISASFDSGQSCVA